MNGSKAMAFVRSNRVLVFAILFCTACAPTIARLPTQQTGDPVLGLELEKFTSQCLTTVGATGTVDIVGVIDGTRVRSRLWYGVMLNLAMRLETDDASSGSQFVFSSIGEEATLFLPQSNTVISRYSASDTLNAAVGLPLPATTWERLLVCPAGGAFGEAVGLPDGWVRMSGESSDGQFIVSYLRRSRTRRLNLIAMLGRGTGNATGWRADFHNRQHNGWRTVRLTSVDSIGRQRDQYDLVLTVKPTQINPLLDRSHLSAAVPPTAREMTLESVRGSNLLAATESR